MSDSDTDSGCLSVNNVFGFPNDNTLVRVKGPHTNSMLNLNLNTNSIPAPRNMEWQRLPDLSMQPRNFQSSFRGFAQSSMISGRAPSPTLSMCSNISTADIVAALKSRKFNKHEWRSLSEAFSKSKKGHIRKRMARRRNRKLTLKGARRQSGYDSGELGSDSSMSSDDCCSTRTGITATNRCSRSIYTKSRGRRSDDARSVQTDVNEFRRRINNPAMNCFSRPTYAKSRGETSSDEAQLIHTDVNELRRSFKQSMNRCSRSVYTNSRGGRSSDDTRSIQTDVNELRRTIKDKTLFRDCTEQLKQNSFKNIFSLRPRSANNASMNKMQNNNTTVQSVLQNNRFKNSFPLPSQRFAQSKSVLPIPEECNENLVFQVKKKSPILPSISQRVASHNDNNPTESEIDESIFSEATDPDNSILKQPETQRKRNLNSSDDSICSENKKTKLSSPKHLTEKVASASKPSTNNHAKETFNDFVFTKPQAPVRKLSSMKKQVHVANVVQKSKCPTVYKALSPIQKLQSAIKKPQSTTKKPLSPINKPLSPIRKPLSSMKKPSSPIKKPSSPINKPTQERASLDEHSETMQASTSEVSMRPSFMKRKLFKQTLDVTENKNSAESSPSGSPAKGYSELPKEKNKARKLVTSQSCLSRDIPCDENILLDLIHKIVPPDRMNVTTNTTQRIEIRPQTNTTVKDSNNDKEVSDQWDVTAVLSNCRNDDHSDTYTDEDIFVVHDKKVSKKEITKETVDKKRTIETTQCTKIPLKGKLDTKKCNVVLERVNGVKGNEENTKEPKKTVSNYAHAFWNCDSESEGQDTPKQQKCAKETSGNILKKQKSAAITSKNALVVKNIKSVLDAPKPSNDSNISLEEIGNNIQTLTSNRSLRLKAAKALKEQSMNSPKPCRREELQQSICNKLKRGKSIKDQSSFSLNSSHSKKPVKKKGEPGLDKTKKTSQSKTETSQNQKNCINTRSKLTNKKNIASLTCFNKDESESPHLDFTRRGRPRKLSNAANASVSALQQDASALLQDETVSSNTSKRGRGRPRKVPKNTSNAKVKDSTDTGTKNAKNKTAKAPEKPKPLSTNKTTRSKILETPTKTNIEMSSKLKASKKKIATQKNSSKTEQQKNTSPKKNKQAPLKTDKDTKNDQPKNTSKETVQPNATKETVQTKNATKENTKNGTKPLRNSNLEDYFCRRTRSSREKSFLSPAKAPNPPTKIKTGRTRSSREKSFLSPAKAPNPPTKSKTGRTRSSREKSFLSPAKAPNPPTKSKTGSTRRKEPLKPPKTKPSKTQIADDSTTSDKENTIHNLTQKARRIIQNTSIFQCCRSETPRRNTPPDFPKPINEPFQKANIRTEKLVEVAVSPSVSMRSFRSVRDKRKESCKWNLGIAKATIGVVPWHCAAEEPSKTIIDDDSKSVTVRSIASTSILSRGGRHKFLHVW